MKRFQNNTTWLSVAAAVEHAEQLLQQGTNMMFDLTVKTDWKYGAKQVPYNMLKPNKIINVYTYKPWYRWSSAIGYSDSSGVHINVRKLPYMSHTDIVANLLHEFAHQQGFTHGNNYKTADKCLYSVPYYISENISKWI